jgi:site-specific recombinase XerD
MTSDLIELVPGTLQQTGLPELPAIVADAGERARTRFIEFFTAEIRNPNTRRAYTQAVARFCRWCEVKNVGLGVVSPLLVSAYIEELGRKTEDGGAGLSKPSVKQHLAAIRMLFDYLVTDQVVPVNPATSVRGPRYVVKKGKTLVLDGEQAHKLLQSIDTGKLSGLRDRAIIGVMVYSFARVGAVTGMNVEDYAEGPGRTMLFRLHEKGGKHHEVPAHHRAAEYVDAYLKAAGIAAERKGSLFRSVDREGKVTQTRLNRRKVWQMIKRRARRVGLPARCSAHTFRATGITVYLSNGGTLEHAQQIAAHSSPRTTKLYDRTDDQVTMDEINRIDLMKKEGKRGTSIIR